MPSQARSSPTRAPAKSAASTPTMTLPVTLAATDAAHAPTRNLPSMAMFSMPSRSDRMPAKAPRECGSPHQLRDPGRSDDETRQDPQHADARRERRQLAALLVDPEGERRRRAERIPGGRERDDPEHGHDRAADARRTERLPRGGPHLGPARDHRRGHARAPSTAVPVGVRGARRRQIERTNPGAATNMSTSAWLKTS